MELTVSSLAENACLARVLPLRPSTARCQDSGDDRRSYGASKARSPRIFRRATSTCNRRLGAGARAFGLPQNLRYLIGIDGDQYARIGVHSRRARTCGRVFVRECAPAGVRVTGSLCQQDTKGSCTPSSPIVRIRNRLLALPVYHVWCRSIDRPIDRVACLLIPALYYL